MARHHGLGACGLGSWALGGGDDLDEVLLHLKKVKAVIATAGSRAMSDDPTEMVEELPPCREVPSALHRDADDPEAASYCHEHDTRFFPPRAEERATVMEPSQVGW
jgi:hypothetical protein